jgi:acetyl-CoA carboxylase biotin carboxyl carrier protein
MEIKELQQIISILKENDVTRFELEQKGVKLRLSRLGATGPQEGTNGHQAMQSFSMAAVQPAFPRQMDGGAALAPHHVQAQVSSSTGVSSQSSPPSNPSVSQSTEHLTKVDSPLVGTFYRKPSPDAEPFVREGQMVRKGDTLCIVEAMKLMNEIEAPVSGRVERILVPDAHVVEFGEVLFLIDATA